MNIYKKYCQLEFNFKLRKVSSIRSNIVNVMIIIYVLLYF